MKKTLLLLIVTSLAALPLFGQASQPQPKSQEEAQAIMAMFNAQNHDARIEAANNLLTEFKDTEFKEQAYYLMMESYGAKQDFENMLLFGEKTLEINPEHVPTLVSLAFAIPQRTREFDLDKEEKLARAEDYARRALKLIPTFESPNPNTSPDQWLLVKKDLMAQVHESLGSIALLRKDYAKAEESFREALDVAAEQGSSTFYRLGQVLKEQGKYDEAITALDQSISRGGVPLTSGRDAAEILKAEVQKLKEADAPPPSETETQDPDTPQVKIVEP